MQLSDKFFTFDTGEKSHFFDIITSSGLSLSLLSIGASIQKIAFKGKKWSDHPETDGNELPITLSSGNPDFYRLCPCYAGATLAPNAGRISGSSILLGRETIPLTPNEGANQLHGGPHNLPRLKSGQAPECSFRNAPPDNRFHRNFPCDTAPPPRLRPQSEVHG